MNLSIPIYRTCALLLFFTSSQAPLHAMEIETEKTFSAEELILLKGNLNRIPNDIILYMASPTNNTYKEIMQKLPITNKLLRLNTYFKKLFASKITYYQKVLDSANAYDKDDGYTPLKKAIINKNINEIIRLINNGADVNKLSNDSVQRVVPLYAVINQNYDEAIAIQIAQILLQYGADVNAPNNNSNSFTPLANALVRNKLGLAQLFIDYGANMRIYPLLSLTPLEFAKKINNQAAIDLITHAIKNQNKKQKNN